MRHDAESCRKILGPAVAHLDILDQILPVVQKHRYKFIDDEAYTHFCTSEAYNVVDDNLILSLELIEKAHLASVTSMIRTQRWIDGVLQAYETQNFLAFAGAFRGLLESAGDSMDGLQHMPVQLAHAQHWIKMGLSGGQKDKRIGYTEIEKILDHYVLATWMRRPKGETPVALAKDNIEYVAQLEGLIPDVHQLYHRLCSFVHPSSASIAWMFSPLEEDGIALIVNDQSQINSLLERWPEAIRLSFSASINMALLTLRVLHRFPVHPKLPLKDLTWIKGWPVVEQALKKASVVTVTKVVK